MDIVIVLCLILLNGVFACSEIAVVSSRRERLRQSAKGGSRGAATALKLAEDSTGFLSTIQIGITLIGILLGAYGETYFAEPLARRLAQVPALAPYALAISMAIVVAVMTYLALIIGELVPKKLALLFPEVVATAISRPMAFLAAITRPVGAMLAGSTDLLLHLFGVGAPKEQPVTADEIKGLMEQGAEAGVFEQSEQDLVKNILRLGDRKVSSLMTPRTQMVSLGMEENLDKIRRKIAGRPFTRFPVVQGSADKVVGVVATNDILSTLLAGRHLDLKAVMQPPVFAPANSSALDLLQTFRENRTHTVFVFDEYGVVQGLITLNDLLGAIVGDFPMEGIEGEVEIVERADGSWLIGGKTLLDDFQAAVGIEVMTAEDHGDYRTVAGFVMMQLGRLPKAGDFFEWRHWRVEVMDMDGNRVDKVLVARLPKADPEVPEVDGSPQD
ncbi:MAG: hemolysin family protein [Candidatus Sumerlaeaceae bacterium]|nr:hemolysin family protein [Candidatus Sumerlaeaceae bacterium]